jgi:hypothetical protein
MSVFSGPEIANDGLVFAYDMGNLQKSWKGAPTVNYITSPTEEMARGEFGQYRDLAPTFNTYGLVPYSLSMDIKVNKPGNVLVYMQNGSSTKYGFVSSNINATTEYQRFYFNNLTPVISTPSDTAATLATYTGYGSGVTPTVKNIQLELGTFATPFVNGTRSNTQAIVDLTGRNTVTASSLTYASDGTFSFNGSGNNISIPSVDFSSAQTIEIWLKPEENDGVRRNPYNQAYGGYGTWTHEPSGVINYYYGDAGANTSPYIGHTSGFSVAQNEIACVCTTRDTSTSWWYKNGVQYNSYSHGFGSLTTDNSSILIGTGYAGSYLGKIYAVKLYNRALSAAEVQQNFNALRRIYGI